MPLAKRPAVRYSGGMPELKSYHCALITGASAGLGEEYAMQLAPLCGHLVLVARRLDLLENLAGKIRTKFPATGVTVMAIDLADPLSRVILAGRLAELDLVPDLLINNAGLGDYGEFATAEWPKLEAMLKVNVEALTHLAHLLLPGMIQQGRGGIVNVSSLASLLPIPDFAVYAATKAYVTSFSEALRIELREHGIRVLAVCPGPVKTEFGEVARRRDGLSEIPSKKGFYVPKEQVVGESLSALAQDRPRVYPGLKIAAAAFLLTAIPMGLLRLALARRPRRG
jgi:uncharacterized protein